MNTHLTKHAQNRVQQRGIPEMVIEWLQKFGSYEYVGNGAKKYFFDKKSRKKLKKYAGQLYGDFQHYLNTFVIIAPNNTVITVAFRNKRILR